MKFRAESCVDGVDGVDDCACGSNGCLNRNGEVIFVLVQYIITTHGALANIDAIVNFLVSRTKYCHIHF